MIEYLYDIGHWISVRYPILISAAVEVFIIFIFVYAFLRIMQGTRGAGILKGLGVFVVVLVVAAMLVTRKFRLENLNWVMTRLAPVFLIPLFILFQPEIRRALIRLGQNPLFRMFAD